jgi:hypothetical protein
MMYSISSSEEEHFYIDSHMLNLLQHICKSYSMKHGIPNGIIYNGFCFKVLPYSIEFAQLSIKYCTLNCHTFKNSFYLVLLSTGETPNVDYTVSLKLKSETRRVP